MENVSVWVRVKEKPEKKHKEKLVKKENKLQDRPHKKGSDPWENAINWS